MVLMSWRCLSHVYRDVLRLAPQAALCAPAGHIQSDRLFDNASPESKALLHLVSVRSHTTRTPRGLGPPDLEFVLDSLAGPSERTMAQCGVFRDWSNGFGDCAAPRAHPRAWAGRAVLSGVRRL